MSRIIAATSKWHRGDAASNALIPMTRLTIQWTIALINHKQQNSYYLQIIINNPVVCTFNKSIACISIIQKVFKESYACSLWGPNPWNPAAPYACSLLGPNSWESVAHMHVRWGPNPWEPAAPSWYLVGVYDLVFRTREILQPRPDTL